MLVILIFLLFLGHVCGLRDNKIFILRNLALWIDFRAARKVRKRLATENLFLYLIFVKMGPNLVEKFYWIRHIYYRSYLSLLKSLQTLLEIYIVPLLATSGFIVVISGVSELLALLAISYLNAKSDIVFPRP